MLKFSGTVIWRLGTRSMVKRYTTSTTIVLENDKIDSKKNLIEKAGKEDVQKENLGLLSAVFTSLNAPEETIKPSPKSMKKSHSQNIEVQLQNATNVESLLAIAENPVIPRRIALKLVSVLSEWSTSNKVKISDFEKDPRFLKLCRILGRSTSAEAVMSLTLAEDLNTVLGITGDDEAARLISNLTLPQMIKVMKSLHSKRRRSTPLLRALSHNITQLGEVIDLKKSADILYCMAALNFPDPVLIDRICSDVIQRLPENKDRPVVVTSIVVSLGLLKYRHEPVLQAIADWVQTNESKCRASDIAATVITLATVDFIPIDSNKLFEMSLKLKMEEMTRAANWLDLVYSLLTLEKATPKHLESTIEPDFIDLMLSAGEIPIPSRRKLMAIDAYLHLNKWSTQRLAEDISVGIPLMYTKEKNLYVQSVMDTFKSLLSSDKFIRRECNSQMGFLYDAEFAVDDKCNPVPLEKAAKDKSVHRVAVLCLEYHDLSRRVPRPLGLVRLHQRLLALKGFKVLQIPYTEYNPKDNLVTRVQYIQKQLKELISNTSS